MKRIPRRTAKRIFPLLLVLLFAAILAYAFVPAARLVMGIVLAVLLAGMLAMAHWGFRCPSCGAQTHPKDDACPQCGAKLEE